MPASSPWPSGPCPSWCTRPHAEDDHPDDRAHTSDGVDVPAIERVTTFAPGGVAYRRAAIALQLGLHQVVGEETTWVYSGDGERRGFEVGATDAREVARALLRLVSAIDAPREV